MQAYSSDSSRKKGQTLSSYVSEVLKRVAADSNLDFLVGKTAKAFRNMKDYAYHNNQKFADSATVTKIAKFHSVMKYLVFDGPFISAADKNGTNKSLILHSTSLRLNILHGKLR